MILVDTSVWADHFRHGEPVLAALLGEGRIMTHPFVTGELALGNLRDWSDTVAALCELPQAVTAGQADFLATVAGENLVASGIGFVDAHLLVSARREGLRLWTRDKQLGAKAAALGLSWQEP